MALFVRSFVSLFCFKEQFQYGIKGIGWMDHIFLDKRYPIEGVYINSSSILLLMSYYYLSNISERINFHNDFKCLSDLLVIQM